MTTDLTSPSEGYRGNPWIHTQAGPWYINNPTFNVDSMAHALGQLVRYNGNGNFFYSVAEHSVLVSLLMEELKLGDPLEGLLHDGTEAFMSDIPSPFKQLLPDWKRAEAPVEAAMRAYFSLPSTKTPECKKADWLALFIEAYQLIPSRGADFEDPHGLRAEALCLRNQGWMIRGLEWQHAADIFLSRYHELVSRKRK